MSLGFFVTSTGTEIGKTYVSRGFSRALTNRGFLVSAIKPIETGCDPYPFDALSLARACSRSDLAYASGLYRANLPLSPYSTSLLSSSPPPDVHFLSSRIIQLFQGSDVLIVESAGGLLSPLDSHRTMADLALVLSLPLLVVVRDFLGVISQTLTLLESALSRGLRVCAVVLVRHERGEFDLSPGSNYSILRDRLSCPLFPFPFCSDDDTLLSLAAESSGLLSLVHSY